MLIDNTPQKLKEVAYHNIPSSLSRTFRTNKLFLHVPKTLIIEEMKVFSDTHTTILCFLLRLIAKSVGLR